MMEKRRKELIIFACVIGVLGLLVVMTLGRGKRPRSQPAAKKAEVQVAMQTDTSRGGATDDQQPQADQDKGPLVPPQGNIVGHPRERDPFVPTVNVGIAATAVQTAATAPQGSPGIPPVPLGTGRPPAPSLPIPGWISQIQPANPYVGSTIEPPPRPQDPIVLTGIIVCSQGDPPVAIFRRAGKRFIVKPGDTFAGYRVIEISAQRVALARGTKHHTLFLGGKL